MPLDDLGKVEMAPDREASTIARSLPKPLAFLVAPKTQELATAVLTRTYYVE
jgi:hypothetical protein